MGPFHFQRFLSLSLLLSILLPGCSPEGDLQNRSLIGALTFPPRVTAVYPIAGALAGGTPMTIFGTGFLTDASVSIGGVDCESATVISSTMILCMTGPRDPGLVTVTVINSDLQSGELRRAYTYQPAPTVASITPAAGAIAGGTSVAVLGTGFLTGATVSIGEVPCSNAVVDSVTKITCITGSNVAGTQRVIVTNPDTQFGVLEGAYTYQLAPTVTKISPVAGALGGGTVVTIEGTGFLSGATVSIAGISCSAPTLNSSNALTCITGPNTAGTGSVVVTNADTQSGSLANAYTYQAAPTVASINPTTGPSAGGTVVTVTGTGFLTGVTVKIGDVDCNNLTLNSPTMITCTTGAHATGSATVVVTNSDTQSASLVDGFTFE